MWNSKCDVGISELYTQINHHRKNNSLMFKKQKLKKKQL